MNKSFLFRSLFRMPIYLVVFFVFSFFVFLKPAQAAPFFTDNFTSGSGNWTPSSGAWIAEDSAYKHKEIGVNYDQTNKLLFSDDFSSPNPVVTNTSTPFTDTFTEADGPASQWTVKRGTFAVASNAYRVNTSTAALSIASSTGSSSWSDYRLTAKVKREGASDVSGYSLIYFRLVMTDATKDSSYALLVRQTGVLELYTRTNGSFITSLATATIPKDNNYHDVIILAVGTSIKVWFDKAETEIADIYVEDSTYATGTIGLGTTSWASDFDDVNVDLVSSTYRWQNKIGRFFAQGGDFYAKGDGGTVRTLSIPTSTTSTGFENWNNYHITTKLKRGSAIGSSFYSIIYFRTTMVGATSSNSYVLLFRNNGTLELGKITNGWGSYVKIGIDVTISQDNDYHDVIIKVVGETVRVWFDIAETQIPTMEYGDLTDFTTGSVGVGLCDVTSILSNFDDFEVENILLSDPAPKHIYSDVSNSTTIAFSSSVNMDSLQVSITNPASTTWTLTSPAGCIGQKSCTLNFPTDFSGANLNVLGPYKLTAINGDDSAYTIIEVREKPILSFIDVSDTHWTTSTASLNALDNFVANINAQKYFSLPNFVVLTGDLTDNGYSDELTAVKSELDTLSASYYPINGNHDTAAESGAEQGHYWANVFGADKFSYNWTSGDNLFLAMDTLAAYGGLGDSLCSSEHKTWLQGILDANPDKFVFLFSHYGLSPVRNGGDGEDFWQGESGSCSTQVRTILESHNNFVAQFSGHSHINGLNSLNDINYFQTGGYVNNGEYRYVEIYDDRMESFILKDRYYFNDQVAGPDYWDADYWHPSTDTLHSDVLYTYGLPIERQFQISLATTTHPINVLDSVATAGNTAWRDYTYQADVTLNSEVSAEFGLYGENVAGLAFRSADTNNYYSVMLDSATDTIKLYKKQAGVITQLTSASATIATGTLYTVKVTAQGSSIKIYLNDVLKIDATDGTFSAGKIGLQTYRASTEYDNVSVTDLSNPVAFNLSSPANDATVANSSPTFSWASSSDSESGLSKYQLYIDDVLDTDNIATTTTSITPADSLIDGNHTWYVVAVDASGNSVSSSATYNIIINTVVVTTGGSSYVDTSPPVNTSIVINGGASIVTSTHVTLILGATDAAWMIIDNSSDFSSGILEPYATNKSWILTSATGTKKIYIKFRDSSGNESIPIFVSVTLLTPSEAVTYVASTSTIPTPPITNPSTPDASCPTIISGDMVKVIGKPAIYAVNKYLQILYFPSGDEFKSWRPTYGGYKSITQVCFDSLNVPTSYPAAVNYHPGSYIIKRPSSDQLYVIEPNNTLSKISSTTAKSLYSTSAYTGGTGYKIMTVADPFWPHYINRASDIASVKVHHGMLIKTNNIIYYVDATNQLREVTDAGFIANQFQQRFVRVVPTSAIQGLTFGDKITSEIKTLTDKMQSGE